MAKNILVVSCDVRETRAALIEDGIIAELHIERSGADASTVGNVYVGKVTRVLPGLQAAFIDIGQERAAFLHVEDLIRPDDFDAYLAGGRKHARGEARVVEADVPPVDEDGEGDDDEAPITAVSAVSESGTPAVPAEPPSHVELALGSEAALPLEGAVDDSLGDVAALTDESQPELLGEVQGDDLDEAPDSDEPAVAPEPLAAADDDGDDLEADDGDDLEAGDADLEGVDADDATEAEEPALADAATDGFPEDLPGFTISDP
ncbi:MAG TPA: ribonuclease G, partial [Polyangiaceae bacterium]|nr:ribonuclease G [Polyangiaceae bacterium]